MRKEALLLETKRQVMQYKLKIKEQLEQKNKEKLLERRGHRRKAAAARAGARDLDLGDQDDGYALSEGDEEAEYDGNADQYGDRQQYDQQDIGVMGTAHGRVNRYDHR